MTSLRTVLQREVIENIEYGEAILIALNLKAQRHLELIARLHDADTLALLRLLLEIQAVQEKLGRERHRLSTFAA